MWNRSHRRVIKRGRQPPEVGILERFSPIKIGKIVPTSTRKKEDMVASFRPNIGECLNYDISQTELKMDVGDTKIHVRDTRASYIPAPPPTPKKKNKKDQAPSMKFLSEIWMEEQNALQEQYKKDLIRNVKKHKIEERSKDRGMHNVILSMVGPEWFQELSPNQLRAVDQLHCCIVTDIKNKTITNVQENIGKLGLVLRPNHRHIEKALRLCCKNPVEFLLILYQLINPKRKEYSLNDRLLLSAVVHLCMTDTLRELHVRIPSPPKHKTIGRKRKKVDKKVTYTSPYLQPLSFTPVPPKHTGIYENPRKQYPESPYFSYLQSLHIERQSADDVLQIDLSVFSSEEVEILEDMKRAQLIYNEIQKSDRVKLLRPTIVEQCKDSLSFYASMRRSPRKVIELPPLCKLEDSEDEECHCCEIEEEEDDIRDEEMNCECCGKCYCHRKARKFTSVKCKGCLSRERKQFVQRIIKGITITRDNEAIPIIEATVLQETCDCLQKYQDSIVASKARDILYNQKARYVIGGVVMTKTGPVYFLSTALKKTKKKILISTDLSSGTEQVKETCAKDKRPVFPEDTEDFKERSCKHTDSLKNEKSSECKCKALQTERSTNTESCTCKKNTSDAEDVDSSPCDCADCDCKQRSKMYTGSRCKKCEEKERRKYLLMIITGMKETASHKILPIIEGTCLLNSCDCVQKYAERILSMEARNKIENQRSQFVNAGVALTKIGPVYILSTAVLSRRESKTCHNPKRKRSRSKEAKRSVEEEEDDDQEDVKYSGCKCKEELDRFLAHKCTCEECNSKKKPKEPTEEGLEEEEQQEEKCDCLEKYKEKIDKLEEYRKRIEVRYNLKSQTLKYSIGGVVNTPNGPVYVITGLRPPVDCACAKAAREKEERELQLQQMAKMPATGRIKYQISGVCQTPDGNVFIISQALPTEDCECIKLYDTYAEAHKACLDMYEGFLQQTNEALEEFTSEMAGTINLSSELDHPVSEITEYEHQDLKDAIATKTIPLDSENNSFSNYNLFEKGEVVRAIHERCTGQRLKICSRGEVVSLSDESFFSDCECLEEDDDEEPSSESEKCPNIRLDDLKRSSPVEDEAEPVQVVERKELQRYVILEEIPKNLKKQTDILKKVLAKMADDGFPLAKLPDCHKLPHFKLWMQLRCGKFWRQKDIDSYEKLSKNGWNHTDTCRIKFTLPNLGLTTKQAEKMTWQHARYVKKLVGDKVEMFYREVSRETVDRAREFFPLTFSYEFPNKTFRDVYFAYMPSKEKDTLAFRIVKPHEARVIYNKYSCYC